MWQVPIGALWIYASVNVMISLEVLIYLVIIGTRGTSNVLWASNGPKS